MRYFNVRIEVGTSTSLYNIYYDLVDVNNLATIYNTDGTTQTATNITYDQLISVNGVEVGVPDTMTSILLYDSTSGFCQTTSSSTKSLSVAPSCGLSGNAIYGAISVNPQLVLTFDNILNADLMVGNCHNVSDWNTFFYPSSGTNFTAVYVYGNTVNLVGGTNIHLKDSLFGNNPHGINLLSIVDSTNNCVTSLGYNVFGYDDTGPGCINLNTVILPNLLSIGNYCFEGCSLVSNFNFPVVTTIGDGAFYNCTSATGFTFPSCLNLGSTTGNNYVFYGISGLIINLSVPSALMTCDGGNPDGDIQLLSSSNTVISLPLELTFDNITYADTLVGDSTNVNDWNVFFGISGTSSAFLSVTVSGNTVNLIGGSNINLSNYLFSTSMTCAPHLIKFIDYAGCIISVGFESFGKGLGTNYPTINLTTVTLPNVRTVSIWAFAACTGITEFNLPLLTGTTPGSFFNCTSVTGFTFPSLITTNLFVDVLSGITGSVCSAVITGQTSMIFYFELLGSFSGCIGVTEFNFPLLESTGDGCFAMCTGVTNFSFPFLREMTGGEFLFCSGATSFNFPLLTTIGCASFEGCSSTAEFNFPYVTTIGDAAFMNCYDVTTFNLSTCTSLGTTVGNNCVFSGITGNTIYLTVPSSLLTCNTGSTPDGDIQYLLDNDIVNPGLLLTFDNITNADSMVGDSTNLSDWNVFFGLSGYSSFTMVQVFGNIVNLTGGYGIALSDSLFGNNTYSVNLLSIIDTKGVIISCGYNVFGNDLSTGCINLTTVNLPSLTIAGITCFSGAASLVDITLPQLTTAGDGCFYSCGSISGITFPLLMVASDSCFGNCPSLTDIDLPSLITAVSNCFYNCSNVIEFNLPLATTLGDYCFNNCSSATGFTLPSCLNLGSTTGYDHVFDGITGNNVLLVVPPALMICNGGNPDGDIQSLLSNNTQNFSGLQLTFDNITNADLMVGDSSNVTDWNNFFMIPPDSQFSNVQISGNTVVLLGGNNITLIESVFGGFLYGTNLLSIIDINGVITSAGPNAFGVYPATYGCPNLTTVILPNLTVVGDYCFFDCYSVTEFTLPSLITAGINSFSYCNGLYSITLPSLTTAGQGCFNSSTNIISFTLDSLVTAGYECFNDCYSTTGFTLPSLTTVAEACFSFTTGATIYNLPLLTTIGDACFVECYSSTDFYLPSCVALGTTTGNNNVFNLITGKTISLTVPSALITCDAGYPDGDIQYLVAHNTVTITTV